MKKGLLFFFMIMLISNTVFAAEVQLNGEIMNFADDKGNVKAQIINDRTMVPARKIFEALGAEVGWIEETQTVTATKDNIEIVLQINNEIAVVIEDGIRKEIKLDSKPIIINYRTLVPLRFISESLGKQVGWDQINQTAIIIDYDYFANKIKEKAPVLYNNITNQSENTKIEFVREYIDLQDQSKNNNSKINVSIKQEAPNIQKLNLEFDGSSELFKEIIKEGWNKSSLNLIYTDSGINYSTTTTDPLFKLLDGNEKTYEEIGLQGSYDMEFSELMKVLLNIDENELDVNTFINIKNEYEKLLSLFSVTNTNNISTITCSSLNYENANLKFIDYTKFDNVIIDNKLIQVYNAINKLFFNYDITKDELLYDYSNIKIEMIASTQNEVDSLNIKMEIINDYNEKLIYNIKINNN